jgi:hypothetical protein
MRRVEHRRADTLGSEARRGQLGQDLSGLCVDLARAFAAARFHRHGENASPSGLGRHVRGLRQVQGLPDVLFEDAALRQRFRRRHDAGHGRAAQEHARLGAEPIRLENRPEAARSEPDQHAGDDRPAYASDPLEARAHR